MLNENDRKLAELIIYVSEKCDGDGNFGATKLNKILFYADFIHFARAGRSITGQEYFKLANGPAPRRLVPVRDELEGAGDIVLQPRVRYGHTQVRTVPMREADLSDFSGFEIAVVEEVIEGFWHANARQLSELLHTFEGWMFAGERQVIPYEAVFLGDREPTEAEKAYALEL